MRVEERSSTLRVKMEAWCPANDSRNASCSASTGRV
jgi:hypothetical protein